jgi:hypothetical protein
MLPAQLRPEHFAAYPEKARQLAVNNLELLRRLPLSYVPLLLREVIAYDWKFPAERQELDAQFVYLAALSLQELRHAMASFEAITLSSDLERFNWVKDPRLFSAQLSAHLWATHQINAFRTAAMEFMNAFHSAAPQSPPSMPRLIIIAVGQGVVETQYPLFRKLRRYGRYFTQVEVANGWRALLNRVTARAAAHPIPFAHWYIDGGSPQVISSAHLTHLSYGALAPVRTAVVEKMRSMRNSGSGTEELRTALSQMRPEAAGLTSEADYDRVLNHFKINVMAESSGAEFFSTTFVQWAARELLRRAQPVTLLARFAPRQTERSMNELLAGSQKAPALDPEGSLVDADMGAYYIWLSQRRLPGASQGSFLVWFEDHAEALVVSPSAQQGTQSDAPAKLSELLDFLMA